MPPLNNNNIYTPAPVNGVTEISNTALQNRADAVDAAINGLQSDVALVSPLQSEVAAARGGRATLDARFGAIEGTASTLAAQMEAEDGGDNFATFNWFNYIPMDQLALIAQHDVAGQDEAVVTAGLRAMLDAAMAFMLAGNNRVVKIRCEGTLAVNDEIASDDFAEKYWSNGFKARLIFDGDPVIQAKNWIAAVRPRNTGLYRENGITDPVPVAMLRLEASAKFERELEIRNWKFRGEFNIATDPIGIMMRNSNFPELDINVEGFAQGGLHISDLNNGDGGGGVRGRVLRCGANITGAGGNGLLPVDVRAAVVPGSGTSALSLVNEDGTPYAGGFQFLPEHVDREIVVVRIGVNGEDFTARIVSVDSPTTATLSRQANSACTANNLSFTYLPVDTVAGSPNITLPPNMTLDLTGRYVGIVGGGSTNSPVGANGIPEYDTPYVRVVSHDLATGAVVLATPLRNTVVGAALCMGLSVYLGKDADQVNPDGTPVGGHWNDAVVSLSIENGRDGYVAIPLFAQNILAAQFAFIKLHGVPSDTPNSGAGWTCLIADNCKNMPIYGGMFEWGNHSGEFGKIMAGGARTYLHLVGGQIGDFLSNDSQAIFYTNPQEPGRDNCVIQVDGAFMNAPDFPSANQILVRNGPNGLREHVSGTIRRRNDGGFLDLTQRSGALEIINPSPSIILNDDTDGTAFRISANGGGISIAFSQNGNGVFDAPVFGWTATGGAQLGAGEALFTPVLMIGGVDIASQGGSYAVRSGSFYKAMGLAFVTVDIDLSAKGTGTGAVTIGVPPTIFPQEYNNALQAGIWENFAGLAGAPFGASVAGATDVLALRAPGGGGGGSVVVTHAQLTDTTRIALSGWVKV